MSFRTTWFAFAAAGIILAVKPAPVMAAVPSSITVQGRLTNASGSPLPAGVKTFTFRVFDQSTSGTEVWPGGSGEIQFVTTDANGLWIALLGALQPLNDGIFASTERWLQITVDDGINPVTILPRTRLVSNPFAFRVATIDGASGGAVSGKLSVGPGHNNNGAFSFIAGESNTASADYSSVGGGQTNLATGTGSHVGGGNSNSASGTYSNIGGGTGNRSGGENSTVSGGGYNSARGAYSFVGGGGATPAQPGDSNTAAGYASVVVGGRANRAGGDSSFIGGGNRNQTGNVNTVVAGGAGNTANGSWSSVLGGLGNVTSSQGATIGGGFNNRSSGFYSVVGGGGSSNPSDSNSASNNQATVGGGRRNIASGAQTTVGGGDGNRALSQGATAAGGLENIASGLNSAIAGGASDTANGSHSMIPGGLGNRASGSYSFAAGRRAKSQLDGAFVWADDQNSDFATTNSRQFLIRASNGVGINTNAPEKALHVLGSAKIRDTLFSSFVSSNLGPLALQTAGTTRLFIDETTGNVGINSAIPPTVKFQVGGVIHSMSGGIRFPDGRTQTVGGLIAFAHVASDGTLTSSSNNVTSSFDGVNSRYLISISGEAYSASTYVTVVTVDGLSAPVTSMVNSIGSQLVVTLFDSAGSKVQNAFQFVTYKP